MSDTSVAVERFEFASLGETAVGRLYISQFAQPDTPHPAVVSAPAFGAVKEMLLPDFANALAAAGFACLIFDYIGFGESGGALRQEVAPLQQIQTFRDALTALEQDPRINSKELGVWGTSLSGGHALHAAASDRRVKAAVSITPFISPTNGLLSRLKFVPTVTSDIFHRSILKKPRTNMIAGVGPPGSKAVITDDGALEWTQFVSFDAPNFRNEVTSTSLQNMIQYNAHPHAAMIRVPTLAITAASDKICPANSIRKALEPVKSAAIYEFSGNHFDLLGVELPRILDLTIDWFTMHLKEWKHLSDSSW